jgi:predicted RNA binding protein YcfA (HicA-like mRNA interferase family)
MKVSEAIKLIEREGWYLARRKATGHRKFRHAKKPGYVTIAGNLDDDLAKGTLNSILKQAGLKGSK